MKKKYDKKITAKTWTTILLDECSKLYKGQPADDATVCTIKIRKREPVNLLVGPPVDPGDVLKMMTLFFSKEGKHIVCGGTTSTLAAEYLKKPILSQSDCADRDIPPTAKIDGVDLVTEGMLTIDRVLTYAQNYLENNASYVQWRYKKDGASLISRLLFEEATDINFYVGKAANSAHQTPSSPINLSIKMRLVDELAACLKQMGKSIKVSYF